MNEFSTGSRRSLPGKRLLDKAIFISNDVFCVYVSLLVSKWKRTFCVTAFFPSTGENKEKDPGTILSW